MGEHAENIPHASRAEIFDQSVGNAGLCHDKPSFI